MNRVLLCIDVSNQVYKASAVHPTLESEDRFTGGLYGFLVALSKAILFTNATQIVLCYDTKPYVRSNMYPEYKCLRAEHKDQELADRAAETMKYLELIVQELGLPVWKEPGYEADDLIAHATYRYRGRFSKIIAMSSDSDLYQLFRYPNFALWKGKKGLYEFEDYKKEWEVSPEEFVTLLAMTGTHNEVAGIPDVGPVRAKKAILDPVKLRSLRQLYAKLIDRNVGLIRLPHATFPRDVRLPTMTKVITDRMLIKFNARFDIDTTKAMLDAFNQLK